MKKPERLLKIMKKLLHSFPNNLLLPCFHHCRCHHYFLPVLHLRQARGLHSQVNPTPEMEFQRRRGQHQHHWCPLHTSRVSMAYPLLILPATLTATLSSQVMQNNHPDCEVPSTATSSPSSMSPTSTCPWLPSVTSEV
ncbi:mCG67361 [Mus musculus]|nr:mCG67361 [Mus musculus]